MKILLFLASLAALMVTTSLAHAVNPVPFVNQPLVPGGVAPGSSGFTLTVNGTGFVSGSVVNWNGSARATVFVNGSKLTATILSSDLATVGTATVTVSSPAPGGGKSNSVLFNITYPTSSAALGGTNYTETNGAGFIALGDLNGDGNQDVAIVNGTSDVLVVRLGNADGTFGPEGQPYPVGVQAMQPTIADFNGDGKLDVAVANQNCLSIPCPSGSVSILLGNGDGTFQPQTQVSTAPGPTQVAVGDFNADGRLDLAVAAYADTNSGPSNGTMVSILLGNGDGTFGPHVDYTAGTGVAAVVIDDFNKDGKLDLAVVNETCPGANCTPASFSVLLGNGDGTFQTHQDYVTHGRGPFYAMTADFNGDGNADIAVVNSGSVVVLFGNGDGTFNLAGHLYQVPGAYTGTLADVNGDGIVDIVTANPVSSNISVLFGKGDGTFETPSNTISRKYPEFVVAGDFNHDGRIDLVAINIYGEMLTAFLQSTIALNPAGLHFPPQIVGTTSNPESSTIANVGGSAVNMMGISVVGKNAGDFAQSNNCPASLAPQASCTVTVTFTPSATGTRKAAVKIADDAVSNPQTLPLSGTGK